MSRLRLFADDTIYQRDVTSETGQCQLQQDLDKLAFRDSSRLLLSHNHQLQNVTSAKYIGVQISSDLRWDSHIAETTSRANRTLGFVRRNLRICSRKAKLAAYKAQFTPLHEYASPV